MSNIRTLITGILILLICFATIQTSHALTEEEQALLEQLAGTYQVVIGAGIGGAGTAPEAPATGPGGPRRRGMGAGNASALPALAEFRASFDIETDDMARCVPIGAPRLATVPLSFISIYPSGDTLVLVSAYNGQARQIYLDEREPPEYIFPTKLGWSTGRFDNDELVVTTTHLTEQVIRASQRLPYSGHPDSWIEERFIVTENGVTLQLTTHDPVYFNEPQVRRSVLTRRDQSMLIYDCIPTDY